MNLEFNTYLCGGINGLTDAQCHDWREEAKKLLLTPTLDPMRRDYRGIEAGNEDDIVGWDINDIKASKFILVNACRPSWGTAMEIVYAFKFQKIIITWVGDNERVSPWLVYHSQQIFNHLSDACGYINTEVKKIQSMRNLEEVLYYAVSRRKTPPHIDEIFTELVEYPESKIRGAIWGLLTQDRLQLTKNYTFQLPSNMMTPEETAALAAATAEV